MKCLTVPIICEIKKKRLDLLHLCRLLRRFGSVKSSLVKYYSRNAMMLYANMIFFVSQSSAIPNSISDKTCSTYVVAKEFLASQPRGKNIISVDELVLRSVSLQPTRVTNTSNMAKLSFLLSLLVAALVAFNTQGFAPQQAICKLETTRNGSNESTCPDRIRDTRHH